MADDLSAELARTKEYLQRADRHAVLYHEAAIQLLSVIFELDASLDELQRGRVDHARKALALVRYQPDNWVDLSEVKRKLGDLLTVVVHDDLGGMSAIAEEALAYLNQG